MLEHLNTVEIEVNSRCNRKCDYCPVSILPIPGVQRYMDDSTLHRLLDELVRVEFRGRVSYHFYNEPLLRRDLNKIVAKVQASLPEAFQVLFTNGDLLTDQRYNELLEAGIDFFQVTSHSLEPHPERPHQEVYFPKDLTLTNRGGLMKNLPGVAEETLQLPCYAPSEMLIVTVTGDIVLCYEDAERNHVMGNIMQQSLDEIWYDAEFVHIRQRLAQGQRSEASDICRACTNHAHQIPGTSHIPTP